MTYNVFSGTLNPTHFTSQLPVAKKTQFWANVDISGVAVPTPFIDEGQF